VQQPHRLGVALDHGADVLALVGEAVDAAGGARIDAAAEEIDGLGRAARAGHEAMDGHDLADDGEPGLLLGLAPRYGGGALVAVDDAGDDFELPGSKAGEMSGEAELLDEDDLVALRIVEQDAGGVMAKEDLARQLGAPAAGEQPVPQEEMIDAEEAPIDG